MRRTPFYLQKKAENPLCIKHQGKRGGNYENI